MAFLLMFIHLCSFSQPAMLIPPFLIISTYVHSFYEYVLSVLDDMIRIVIVD